MQIKIIICCRIRLYAEGIKRLLEDSEELKIVGLAFDVEELKGFLPLNPQIILSDFANCASILDGLDKNNLIKVLLINDNQNLSFTYTNLQDMVSKGLAGILQYNSETEILKKAIKAMYSGEMWIDHKTINKILCYNHEDKRDIKLTRKEAEILNFVCSGLTNKNIAEKLFVSEQTVKSHCNHLFKKFGVSSRIKLALKASNLSGKFPTEIEEN